MAKLPLIAPSPGDLRDGYAPRVIDNAEALWRIHRTTSTHPSAWHSMRHYGPLLKMRFDPHPPGPPQTHPDVSVAYLAYDVETVIAEVFQGTRRVDYVTGTPYLSGFVPTRPLALLDLTGDWPIKVGASHVINTGPKNACRAWARAFHLAWPELDGLLYSSSMTGKRAVALFAPASTAFPAAPQVSRALSDAAARRWIIPAADRIGYRF